MRPKNDERKMEIYEYVSSYIKKQGVCPTTQMISDRFGMSKSTVSKYMNRLKEEGKIEKHGRYQTRTAEPIFAFSRMPVVGRVACGKPILAIEDIEGYLPIDETSLGAGEYFGLIADGDSMILAGISDGDIVYIRRQSTAENGDIVVAMLKDDLSGEERATLKRFFRDDRKRCFVLHPENERLSDIVVDEVRIVGKAVRVLKSLK